MKSARARGPSGVVEPPPREVVLVPQHINGDALAHPTLDTVRAGLGHGAEVPGQPARDAAPAARASRQQNLTMLGTSMRGDGAGSIMALDALHGDAVVSRCGELLGKIRNIMIDVPRGRIAYVVLTSGGVLGFGDRLYALPWSALTLDAEKRCFVLDADKERLQASPGFDKDHWPPTADLDFIKSVHHYYGVDLYWTERGSASMDRR